MPIEDFTTYTENDPNSKWTVTAPKVEGANVSGGDGLSNCYKSFGADHFNALDFLWESYCNSSTTPSATNGPALLNSADPDSEKRANLAATDLWHFHINESGLCKIELDRGNIVVRDTYTCSFNTLYYSHTERAAGNDTVTTKIYSDSDRTNLLDTLSISGFGTVKWQYSFAFITHPDGAAGEDWYGYYQNLDFQEAPAAVSRSRAFIF